MYWAMLADSYTSSRPILQKVSRPRQIEFLFDIITYRKGACIIRMINRLLGDFAFKRGLTVRLFLKLEIKLLVAITNKWADESMDLYSLLNCTRIL